jgi:hypothetical protein
MLSGSHEPVYPYPAVLQLASEPAPDPTVVKRVRGVAGIRTPDLTFLWKPDVLTPLKDCPSHVGIWVQEVVVTV